MFGFSWQRVIILSGDFSLKDFNSDIHQIVEHAKPKDVPTSIGGVKNEGSETTGE